MAKKNNMLNFKKLASNKVVLYAVTLIALISIINYIMTLNYNAIILFIAIAGLTYTYTKNMTIVLASSVIFTFILNFVNKTVMREGMERNNSSSEEEEEEEEEVTRGNRSSGNGSGGNGSSENGSGGNGSSGNGSSGNGSGGNGSGGNGSSGNGSGGNGTSGNGTSGNGSSRNGSSGNGSGGNGSAEKYQNYIKLKPSAIPNKESLKKQLGEIDNVEAAYDEYDTAISNNNLKTVSKNTKDIVSKQKDMLNQLKEMTPMLSDAMSSIENINTDGLQQMLEGVNKMADNFTK